MRLASSGQNFLIFTGTDLGANGFSERSMFDKSCIFCKIVQKEINGKLITENEHVLVIEDIAPKAPIHYLIMPKKHVVNLGKAEDADLFYGLEMLKVARELASSL